MGTYNFQITYELDGAQAHHPFNEAGKSLAEAVERSLRMIAQECPEAQFKRLTYFQLPMAPRSYKRQ